MTDLCVVVCQYPLVGLSAKIASIYVKIGCWSVKF